MTLILITRHFGSYSQAMTGGPLKAFNVSNRWIAASWTFHVFSWMWIRAPVVWTDITASKYSSPAGGPTRTRSTRAKNRISHYLFFQKPRRPFIEFLLNTTTFKLNPGVITSLLFYFYIFWLTNDNIILY